MDKLQVVITTAMIRAGASVLAASDVDDQETAFKMFKAMVDASSQVKNLDEETIG